jgi:hypothetical protein
MPVADSAQSVDAIFVQTATHVTFGAGELTLHGLVGSTVYFTDRPRREVGHLATGRFIEFWATGEPSFRDRPPSAVLSFLEPDEGRGDVSLILRDARLAAVDRLTYRVEIADGSLPEESGPCSLFIDGFERHLSPASTPRSSAGAT